MKICIYGADGFIAKNLISRLSNYKKFKLYCITKKTSESDINRILLKSDIIFHLAGINRETKKFHFNDNFNITNNICNILEQNKKKIKIIYTSSLKAKLKNSYGISKKNAENRLIEFKKKTNNQIVILRLPNIFGKWCKPNYNSFVTTLIFNRVRNLKVTVNKNKFLELIYIDDLIDLFLKIIFQKNIKKLINLNSLIYKYKLGFIDDLVKKFISGRDKLLVENNTKDQFVKKLYATFLTYLPNKKFISKIKINKDSRGKFCEFVKNYSYGQISFCTINKQKTRGGHFHNTKVERFLVIQGKVKFIFFNIQTKKKYNYIINSSKPCIIESIPGYSHSIKNISNEKSIILIWCNEVYDKNSPDTYEFLND